MNLNNNNANLSLPKWPFYLGDVLLIGLAAFIWYRSEDFIHSSAIAWCVLLVALGAGLTIIPFIIEYISSLKLSKNQLQEAAEKQFSNMQQVIDKGQGLNRVFSDLIQKLANSADQIEEFALLFNERIVNLDQAVEEGKIESSQKRKAMDNPDKTVMGGDEISPPKFYPPAKKSSGDLDSLTLVAHANIGIGNTPYIRGEGPGLSWNKGTPMAFVEIGKWEWKIENAEGAARVHIFKNDTIAAYGEDIEIGVGEQVEAYPIFPEE